MPPEAPGGIAIQPKPNPFNSRKDMAQSPEQLQAARDLAKQFGLTGADFYQHKQSKSFLISRTGIEKIQYKAGIVVRLEAVKAEPTFAAVKARATRKMKPEGAKTSHALTIETFGSACKDNCQVSYYLEMAEKRALSRAVLKLTDFCQLGVYGEDEMPPEAPVEDAPGKPAAGAGAPASALPAASTGAGPSGLETRERLASARSTRELTELWNSLSEAGRVGLKEEFSQARARIEAAIAEAIKTPLPQKEAAITAPANRPETDAAGLPIVYARPEQVQELTRLLNHPAITRPEKTGVLVTINRFTEDSIKAEIAIWQARIDEREGHDRAEGLRRSLIGFARQHAAAIGPGEVDRLTMLAEDAAMTLPELQAEMNAARAMLTELETAA